MRDKQGRWLSGPDPDRHQLTRRDRRLGYFIARWRIALKYGHRGTWWFRDHVKAWYRQRQA
jgi:hypothetical protein